MTEAENPLYSSYIALCVFNGFSSYTAIALNSVTIYAMTKTSSLPRNLKTLLLSLAVSDLGVGLIVQPLYIARLVMELQPNFENNSAYKTLLITLPIAVYLPSYASFFGVTALTVERFLAIHLHLRYQELVTHKRVVAVVISIWVLSAILSLIRQLLPGRENTLVIFATVDVVYLIATAVLYCKIYLAVRHHANQINAVQVQQEAQNGEMANAARLKKSTVTTLYLYLVFLVCYLPRICMFIASRILGYNALVGRFPYGATLVFLNSSLNPLIYCWKMNHIRHAIVDILRKILQSHN